MGLFAERHERSHAKVCNGRVRPQTEMSMIGSPRNIDLSMFGLLGLRHLPGELEPWERFTSGRPAVLDDGEVADVLAQRVASLYGCEAATFATSTLHAFFDVCTALVDEDVLILRDEHLYPVARWGVERAACHGTPVITFGHHDPDHLESIVSGSQCQRRRPVVFVDGVGPIDWAVTPLAEYLQCVERHAGLLIVDDTQAVGLLGHSPGPDALYGLGGGGSLRWHEIESPHVLVVASLTKAFGVPITAVTGSEELTHWFLTTSQTRVHCSPPSAPTLSALEHALDVNDAHGDELRHRLADNVRHIKSVLRAAGLAAKASYFPVQSVPLPSGIDPPALDTALRTRGVRMLFQRDTGGVTNVLLIVTADHDHAALEFAVNVLRDTLDECPLSPNRVMSQLDSGWIENPARAPLEYLYSGPDSVP
jgi:8-amino-7-oxononanoate synthase